MMELPTHAESNEQGRNNLQKLKFRSKWLKYRLSTPDETDDGNTNLKTLRGRFAERTTSQGISQFHIAPRGCKKVMWAVLSLTAVVMLVVHMYYLCLAYSQYETTTELTVVPSRLIAFPAVTICNSNAIKRDFRSSSGIVKPRNDKYDDRPDIQQLVRDNRFSGHSKEDLIVKAVFDNQLISLDEFTHSVNNVYGNCYTFNKNDNRSTRRSAPGYGLELWLNIQSYTYDEGLYRPVDWVGAVIKVHQPEIEATVEEGGIPVAPGTLNRLALTKTQFTRLGGKYSDCLEDNEVKPETFYNGGYNQAQCENTCLQREVISKCCCYLKILNRNLTTFNESWPQPMEFVDESEPSPTESTTNESFPPPTESTTNEIWPSTTESSTNESFPSPTESTTNESFPPPTESSTNESFPPPTESSTNESFPPPTESTTYESFPPPTESTTNEIWPSTTELPSDQFDDQSTCYRDRMQPCLDNEKCWQEIWNRYDRKELACTECKDLCSETLYDVSTASVDWPAPNAMQNLLDELRKLNSAFLSDLRHLHGDIDLKNIKQNLLKVQIHYERMTITKVKEVPAIGDFEFVSELGGTLGLWIGWTVLTVFEFVEFLMDIIALRLINKPSK